MSKEAVQSMLDAIVLVQAAVKCGERQQYAMGHWALRTAMERLTN